jgi:hypothetical protein
MQRLIRGDESSWISGKRRSDDIYEDVVLGLEGYGKFAEYARLTRDTYDCYDGRRSHDGYTATPHNDDSID